MVEKKNTYSSGESLSETLVAALIISLAMIMLFSGVRVGTDIMSKSKDNYQDYLDAVNNYEKSQASYAIDYQAYQAAQNITGPEPTPYEFGMEPHKHNWN